MPYGWTGVTLEVDLSQGKIEKRETDAKLIENFLGGKGINTKLLWDRVPPEVHPFSPDNLFIVTPGLLCGTVAPGASHTCITYKSPVTESYCQSVMGGFLGAELKHAGYDTIIISGKSPTPVYLWINNDRVEIRDARHLRGKNTDETQGSLRDELKNNKIQTMCIGVAGENKVYHATVEHSVAAVAGRGGAGAIMGDKNLKAIAVYGTMDIAVANPAKLISISERILSRVPVAREATLAKTGYTYVRYGVEWVDEGNCSGLRSPERQQEIRDLGRVAQNYIDRTKLRNVSCSNCQYACREAYLNPDGTSTFMKCGAYYYIMAITQIFDCDFAIQYMGLLQKYGLDIYSTANCISFAIDLYQRGILTREDTDGMQLEWKNAEVAFSLVKKIAYREGIGDLLANGTYRSARQIGKGAEDYAFHSKKLEAPQLRFLYQHHLALGCAFTEGGHFQLDNAIPQFLIHRPREERERYIKDGWFSYPKEYEKYFLDGADPTGVGTYDWEGNCYFTAYDMEQYTLGDATGLCILWMGFWMYASINNRSEVADLISAVTGIDIDEAETTRIARRIINLVKAYHVRDGLKREDDTILKHIFKRTPPPPAKKLEPAMFNKLVDKVYELRGWNKEGIPTKESLEESGLDYVRQDLEKRGILTG